MMKKRNSIPLWIWYLFLILPFWAGGFHTYTAVMTVIIFLTALGREYSKKGYLQIVLNQASILCFTVMLGFCITPLWAADRGLAVFGILRYLPVPLQALLLMQYSQKQKPDFFPVLPICGTAMTIVGCILWAVPSTRDYVVVNGRLSGFLQYPNTFAAFLLAGIAVQWTNKNRKKLDCLVDGVLIAGILLSGSRTAVFLLILLTLGILTPKKIRPAAMCAAAVILCGLCAVLVKREPQITILGRDIGSFLVRILYYRDAMPVILRNPFGLGYMGYRALETTFQTSRYTVSFVHSGLLQMLLDIGWIPSFLFAGVLLKTLCSRKTPSTEKMVLLMISAHAMVDFDLQFFLFWSILLLCLDFEEGTAFHLKISNPVKAIAAISVLMLSAWLGLGDWCYRTGNHETALRITPFHTDALAEQLKSAADPEEMERCADRILELNPTYALAYSAKANAAYARGQVLEMIQNKERAIQLTPYTVEEYCDYIEKLYTVLELFVQKGDTESAAYCLKKLLSVPVMLEATAAKTDPLAYQTGNNSELILPEPYQQLITTLANANPDY